MRKHAPTVLLAMILASIICDILIRARPAHAQSASHFYVDVISHRARQDPTVTVRGSQVVGFACHSDRCYVLSK